MLDVGRKTQPLTDFLKYLPKNIALLAQKLWRNFFCQNPFPAILRRKKIPKALVVRTTKKRFFCGFNNSWLPDIFLKFFY